MQHIFIEFLILTCKWTIKKVEKKEQKSRYPVICGTVFLFLMHFLVYLGDFRCFYFIS